jgi:F-type H+-transporting ATPase subunit b
VNLNATLIAQIIVFLALWWFTARFVWPPITKALDDRSQRIASGLAAADKAKADLRSAELRVEQELAQARSGAADVKSAAERQAGLLIERAREEAADIVGAARKAAEHEAVLAAQKAREQIRDQVAQLAVAGAERILRKEIDAARHAELLEHLKSELA